MVPDLYGEDFFSSLFQPDRAPHRKPGRPPEVDPEKLKRNVIELAFALDENWGKFGWLLWNADRIAEVRSAFRHIVNPRCSLLEPFTTDATRRTTPDKLRKLRNRVAESIQHYRERFKNRRDACDKCECAFNVWVAEPDPVKRAQIQTIRPSLASAYQEAEALEKTSQLERDSLQVELKEQEAYFAQSEILKFVQCKRYEYTPSKLACAMAGLPYVTARVSILQCLKHGINSPPGMAFGTFKIIEPVFREPIVHLAKTIDSLRGFLLKPRNDAPCQVTELRKNWYFVEAAIRFAARDTRAPLDSLPFVAFAEYTRAISSPSAADSILADAQRLIVPGEYERPQSGPDWGPPRKH